jgi:hypothetical protein
MDADRSTSACAPACVPPPVAKHEGPVVMLLGLLDEDRRAAPILTRPTGAAAATA